MRLPYVRRFRDRALLEAGRLWVIAPEGHYSARTRHVGPVAYVADALRTTYGHAAALIWECFEVGLLEPIKPVPAVEVYLVDLAAREERAYAARASA